jgi:hypothetical protein
MKVVIIKGNPKFINNSVAKKYYEDIKKFLLANGVREVVFDPGADYTCPPKADFYVAHSKGVSRKRCFTDKPETIFLKFGDPDGQIHPVDAEWQKVTPPGSGVPPKEHFELIPSQKAAILKAIEEVKAR